MSKAALKSELDYYIANQSGLAVKHLGKYLVIKDHKIIGVYDTEIDAVTETQKKHELGTFLVQKCTLTKDGYTQTFRSRVQFV